MARFSYLFNQEIRNNNPSYVNQGNDAQGQSHPLIVHDVQGSNVTSEEIFEIFLDVHEYKRNELKVKVVDRFIVIKGKHGERMDDISLISKEFTRRYEIPEELDIRKISSFISSDGILCIFGPKTLKKVTREIPIIPVSKPPKSTNFRVIESRLSQTNNQSASHMQPSPQVSVATDNEVKNAEGSVSPPPGVVVPENVVQEHDPEQNIN